MILKHAIPIAAEETAGTLHDKLMGAWRADATETLERIENGTAPREQQDDSQLLCADD